MSVYIPWDFYSSLNLLKAKVTEEQFNMLRAILEAHHRQPATDLEARFPLWAGQPKVSLDEPWAVWFDV